MKNHISQTGSEIKEHIAEPQEDTPDVALEYDLPDDWEFDYIPSCTAGDYGPGNPWDAPGMSIRDFI